MVRDIVKDERFLRRVAEKAVRRDGAVGLDLLDTLKAHSGGCVGMAANMIGEAKAVIAFRAGKSYVLMYNPVIVKREEPYEVEEGCLSLAGTRKAQRYLRIEVAYQDQKWRKRRENFSGFTAQIIQHEVDHLAGVLI